MTIEQLKAKFPNASESFLRANADSVARIPAAKPKPVEVTSRLLCGQSTDEAKLNKTERAYLNYIRGLGYAWIGIQNITLKLADDTRFTPDFSTIDANGSIRFIDTKGGFWREDAKLKIKIAARLFTWAEFVVAQKQKDGWKHIYIKR